MNLRFLGNKEVKNAGWLIGEQVFQMVISLVVSILSARYLGPENHGSLNYTLSIVTLFTSIATLGMEGVVIKKMIAAPEEEGAYLGGCIGLRLLASVLSTIAISAIICVLNPGDWVKLAMALLQSLHLVFKSFHVLDSWFQRHLKSRYAAIGKMAACIVVSAYRILLLICSSNLLWFAFNSALSDIVIAVVLFVFYKKENGQKLRPDLRRGVDVLKESYHFILSGLMVAIYGQMDKIMIGKMLTDTDTGLYAVATAVCGMWIFIPQAVINSFRPMIMELKQKQQEELYLLRLQQLYSAVIWMCILVSVAVCFCGGFIIHLLYGDAYAGAADALRIAVWFETFSMIGTARGIWILCENKNKYVKYYLACGVVVNLILNALLIPVIGINGAALATLVTQITTSIIAPLLFRETKVHTKIVWDAFTLRWWRKR